MKKRIEKKKLEVPFLPQLDDLDANQIISLLDEKGERRTVECLNWKDQFPYRPLTSFSIAHSKKYIYIDFFVRSNYLRAVNFENNSNVYQDSCVEFFISPKDDGYYYNFEFNCIGTVHAAKRKDRHSGELLSDEDLNRIIRYPSCGTKPFNEVEGIFTWNLLVAIPLDILGLEYEEGKPIKVRGNFYKCGDKTSSPHYLSWSAIDTPNPDFHRPEFFGDITLL